MLKKRFNRIKQQWLAYLIAYTTKILMRIILSTCRIHVHGVKEFIEVAEKNRCILMLWHDRLIVVAEILRRYIPQFIYTAFISKSCDADALAIFSRSYSFGRVIRVPHNARHLALTQMIHHLKYHREIVIITPDGPKGPKYRVKPGVAIASKKTSAKIIPFSWNANRCWRLNTWDRLMIPQPFSEICIHFGAAISLYKDSDHLLNDEMAVLQESMHMA